MLSPPINSVAARVEGVLLLDSKFAVVGAMCRGLGEISARESSPGQTFIIEKCSWRVSRVWSLQVVIILQPILEYPGRFTALNGEGSVLR
jgi:hypothetical protein